MTDIAGGKDVRFFQAQNAFLLKLRQTDADEIRQLKAYIEHLQRRNFALEQACENPLQNLQTAAARHLGLQCCV